jgi:hypothetical protein
MRNGTRAIVVLSHNGPVPECTERVRPQKLPVSNETGKSCPFPRPSERDYQSLQAHGSSPCWSSPRLRRSCDPPTPLVRPGGLVGRTPSRGSGAAARLSDPVAGRNSLPFRISCTRYCAWDSLLPIRARWRPGPYGPKPKIIRIPDATRARSGVRLPRVRRPRSARSPLNKTTSGSAAVSPGAGRECPAAGPEWSSTFLAVPRKWPSYTALTYCASVHTRRPAPA